MKSFTILVISISLLTSFGCVRTVKEVEYVKVVETLPDCPRPNRPQLPRLYTNQHIGSKKNISTIDDVIHSLYSYSLQLESTVNCYENRKKDAGTSNTKSDSK